MGYKPIKKPKDDPHSSAPKSSMVDSRPEIEKRPADANKGGTKTGGAKHVS